MKRDEIIPYIEFSYGRDRLGVGCNLVRRFPQKKVPDVGQALPATQARRLRYGTFFSEITLGLMHFDQNLGGLSQAVGHDA